MPEMELICDQPALMAVDATPRVTAPPATKDRLLFIDGLRAIAAISVMFHHLYHNTEMHQALSALCPAWGDSLFAMGARGVQIFFVISGFVISYSLRNTVVTPATAGNFILRRQLRLDPAYWLVLTVAAVEMSIIAAHHQGGTAPHGFATYAANFFYLHHLLGISPIVVISWTLCLEIQFYLLFIVLLLIAQQLHRRLGGSEARCYLVTLAPVALLSLVMRWNSSDHAPWFIFSWYLFAMGVFVQLALARRMSIVFPAIFWALVLAAGIYKQENRLVSGCATAAVIYIAGIRGTLGQWLGHAWIQYFGRISYSLYLTHILVLRSVLNLGVHVTGLSKGPAVMWFLLATACCVGIAHLLHKYVEKPTMELASRFKRREPRAESLSVQAVAGTA